MKELIPFENEKNDALSRLVRFYLKSDIVLTAAEEEILTRWLYADALIRQRRLRLPQMIDDIVVHFGISKYTAQNDITQAQALFASVRTPNKKYLVEQHLEDIRMKIQQAKDDKSLAPFLPKMWAEYTRALALLEDHQEHNDAPAPIIFIGVVAGQEQEQQVSGQFTFEQAKELLKLKRQTTVTEDIDYEDMKNNNA